MIPRPSVQWPEDAVHLEFSALAEIRVLGHDGLELVVSHVGLLRWNLLDLAEPVKDSGGFDLKSRAQLFGPPISCFVKWSML